MFPVPSFPRRRESRASDAWSSWIPASAGTATKNVRAVRWGFAIVLLALWLAATPTFAAADEKQETLPRFASLRWAEVNLRTGPGDRYPIEWVLTKKGLPVEIVQKFDVWRKIRDSQGSTGWVHERMLTGSRTILVTGQTRNLRAEPAATAPIVAHAEAGLIAQLLSCRGTWCRVEAQGVKGWLGRNELWGVLPDEIVE